MNPEVSIIIPTRSRHHLLPARLRTIVERTPELRDGTAELILVIDEDEKSYSQLYTSEPIEAKVVFSKRLEIPSHKWNYAIKFAQGDWLVTLTDDCEPKDDKWLDNALNDTINYGFIGLPDEYEGGIRNQHFTPIWMATRDWLKRYQGGVLIVPHYGIWFADCEIAHRAHNSGTYVVSQKSVIKQLHNDFGTAPDDEIYRIGKSRRRADEVTFELRKLKGFPDDFEGVL